MIPTLITSTLIGLWSYLFTGPLTSEDHIFGPLNASYSEDLQGLSLLWHKYTNCAVCHAGMLSVFLAIFKTAEHYLTMDSLSVTMAVVSIVGTFLTALFTSATVAMVVANVMSIKY